MHPEDGGLGLGALQGRRWGCSGRYPAVFRVPGLISAFRAKTELFWFRNAFRKLSGECSRNLYYSYRKRGCKEEIINSSVKHMCFCFDRRVSSIQIHNLLGNFLLSLWQNSLEKTC